MNNDNRSKSQWVEVVDELGPKFAARAEANDREAAFVAENYAELKARRVFSAGVPADLGGGGATHGELCDMLRRLAHHCPSTALAVSMHTHLLGVAVWRHLHGQPAAPLLSKVAAEQLVLVSTGAGDWLESNGTMTKVEGGYRVTAQKRFASGSPAMGMALTSARYVDPKEGAQVLHFPLPLSAAGVRLGGDWDTLGMRATGSQTLHFEEVFVPEAAVSVRRPQGQWHPSFNVVCAVAVPIFSSVYVGVAERAAQIARGAKRGTTDAATLARLGELENTLFTAQLMLKEMVGYARNYDFTPDLERANATLTCKTLLARATRSCVEKAVELTGGGVFFKKHPLERLWRDVQGVQFHPLQEPAQLNLSGRLAAGLPPV